MKRGAIHIVFRCNMFNVGQTTTPKLLSNAAMASAVSLASWSAVLAAMMDIVKGDGVGVGDVVVVVEGGSGPYFLTRFVMSKSSWFLYLVNRLGKAEILVGLYWL